MTPARGHAGRERGDVQRTVSGLSAGEAAARLAADGPNLLPQPRRPSLLRRLVGELVHFFALMLWAGGSPSSPVCPSSAWPSSPSSSSTRSSRSSRRRGPTGLRKAAIHAAHPGDRASRRQAADPRRRRCRRRRPPVARGRRPGARRRVARHGQPAPGGHLDAHRGERASRSRMAGDCSPAPSSWRARPGPWSSPPAPAPGWQTSPG